MLRYESPFRGHYRHVLTDCTLAGTELAPANPATAVGRRQPRPATFPPSQRIRIDRSAARTHLGFGKGLHFCVGAVLVRRPARLDLKMN